MAPRAESRLLIAWTTGWGEDANRLLCPHYSVPEFPVVILPPVRFEPSSKVPAVEAFVGDRPAAWIDDLITAEARRWAEQRTPPTLLIEVDPAVGLTRAAVDRLLEWAHDVRTST